MEKIKHITYQCPSVGLQLINRVGVSNVLVTLRIDPARGQPNGQTYLNDFMTTGWNLRSVVFLNRNISLPSNYVNVVTIPNSSNMPANDIAQRLRRQWQWN